MFNIANYLERNSKMLATLVLSAFLTACGASGESSDTESSKSSGSGVVDNTVEEIVESVTPVTITAHPQSIAIVEGAEAIFTASANGSGDLTFQWKKDAVELDGETNASLNIASTELSSAGQYLVVVTNVAGSVSSLPALLTVQEIQVDSGGFPPADETPVEEETPVVDETPAEEEAPIVDETPVEEETPVVDENPLAGEPVFASVELSWDIPVLREDGSDLEIYEINGYVIQYGADENNLNLSLSVEGASLDNVVIGELGVGTYYFSIATIDSDGVQGAYSAVLEQIIL
jgi:hypothetical protein